LGYPNPACDWRVTRIPTEAALLQGCLDMNVNTEELHMRRSRLPVAAELGLSLLSCTQQQQPRSTQQDLAYCAKLSQLYQRYVGANPVSSSMDGVTPDVAGGEAVAKCREGDAKSAIPRLERLLKDADIPLPTRT
jgi:hypothetical protein